MAEKPPTSRPLDGLRFGEGSLAYLDPALWRQLTEAAGEEEFCHSWLILQGRLLGGVHRAMVILGPPEKGPFQPVTVWPRGAPDVQNLAAVSEQVLRERKGVVTQEETSHANSAPEALLLHVAYPVRARGLLCGVVAFEIDPRPQDELQSVMRQLQWGVAWLENWVLRREVAQDRDIRERLTIVLDLAAATLEEERFQAAAAAFVTLLASRLACDRVSLGFLEGDQVKVQALSHSAQFRHDLNLIRAIGAAMDEGLDQHRIIIYPSLPETDDAILQAHAALAAQVEDAAICTIPLLDQDGDGYAALTLERTADNPFDPPTVDLLDGVAALVVPILEQKRQNDRLLVKKIWDALRFQAQNLITAGHLTWKVAAGAAVALVLFFALAKGDHRVAASVVIEGSVQRAVPAPFNGYIFEAPVRAGDVVQENQVMCRLDERDLKVERQKWLTQKQQAVLRFREAMAEADAAKMNMYREQGLQAEAQLALIEEQLVRVNILAPFKGLVVKGDLSQSLGAPVERGQVLFEVAPLEAYRVKLQVDDSDINYVQPGQKGEMVLTAMPGDSLPIVVDKVTPVTSVKEGHNFFLVEAKLEQASERLRPGMEGYAKVAAGRQNLLWIWTHSLTDWLRLKAWSLWP